MAAVDEFDLASDAAIEFVALAIAEKRVFANVQGIHSLENVDKILYGECLARLSGPSGRIHSAVEFVPALEVYGASPMLDRYMLKATLSHLTADSRAYLGCNLSADNLVSKEDWRKLQDLLLNHRDVLDRLFIEFTESRPLGNLCFAKSSIATIRALGCRVVIDDFGVGFFSPIALGALDVDVVKIDANFVCNARTSLRGLNALRHLIAYAKCYVGNVVVEGIETASDLDLLSGTGATHVQGFFLSKPVELRTSSAA